MTSPLKPRPGILDIAPYVGGDASAEGVNRIIRLASNENPLGPSPKAIEAYKDLQGELHRYPDGGSNDLRTAIATSEGLDQDRIVCGAGSDELISLLVRAYAGPGDEVLYSEHGFLMYPISAKAVGATPVASPEHNLTTDVDEILAQTTSRTKLVFVANPNNPTGTYISADELRRLRRGLPESVLLVIDAAYAEYVAADDYSAGAELVGESQNVVMTRTFSKIHGLASLRLGWAYCPLAVVDVLNRLRGPFNVSLAAQAAGVAAIEDKSYVEYSRKHNAKWLAWFNEEVAKLGAEPGDCVGNFSLVRFPGPEEKSAAAALSYLKTRGILVRGMGGYGLPDYLRFTIGTEDETRSVVEALDKFLS
ncbi:histidinol-phosphate transaminase [Pelagibius sp. Alg239-R121]|uniref:histidinol-phosphate transaminase n=1 Tax=Pelagibius sp. Alg239-R121 TaxID=2993448 RepID=UPI0024A721FE|nr:histidinol-phosphate transaminase [Pelagibius sp. Alg239-R121]